MDEQHLARPLGLFWWWDPALRQLVRDGVGTAVPDALQELPEGVRASGCGSWVASARRQASFLDLCGVVLAVIGAFCEADAESLAPR